MRCFFKGLWVMGMLLAASAACAAEPYLLQPGDLLVVSVWKEPDLTGEVVVRPDGGISMPLAGALSAAGKSVEDVRAAIDGALRKFIPEPAVTVSVKQALGFQIFVLGKVSKPGQYPINRPVDVMQALSIAGGTTTFAAVNDIHVLRREGERQTAIPFHYSEVESGKHLEQNIILNSGDTVVVP